MISTHNRVGRLIEIRVRAPITAVEIAEMAAAILAGTHQHGSIITIVDVREASVVPTELADLVVSFLRQSNPGLERAGFLAAPSAVFTLQLERVLREAKNPRRRLFHDRYDVERWLAEALSREELLSVRAFLDEGDFEAALSEKGCATKTIPAPAPSFVSSFGATGRFAQAPAPSGALRPAPVLRSAIKRR